MPRADSKDLRQRVIAACGASTLPRREIAVPFQIQRRHPLRLASPLALSGILRASEHLWPHIAAQRVAFQEEVAALVQEDLVFMDESGITTCMTRFYARAPQGQRAIGRAPAGRYERLTLLGAITLEDLSWRS